MAKEYATTTGRYSWSDRTDESGSEPVADDPVPPDIAALSDGSSWELVAVAAANGILFWTWQREV